MRLFCALMWTLLLSSCSPSAPAELAEANSALADAAYEDAARAAERGLAAEPDAVRAWGLELVRLEALARAGAGDRVLADLERLGATHPEQMPATQYAATAYQLRSARQGPAAVQALDLGLKRFPGNPALERLIADSKAAPDVDDAEYQMLKSLGYVE